MFSNAVMLAQLTLEGVSHAPTPKVLTIYFTAVYENAYVEKIINHLRSKYTQIIGFHSKLLFQLDKLKVNFLE